MKYKFSVIDTPDNSMETASYEIQSYGSPREAVAAMKKFYDSGKYENLSIKILIGDMIGGIDLFSVSEGGELQAMWHLQNEFKQS